MTPLSDYHPDAGRNFAEKGEQLRQTLQPSAPARRDAPPLFPTDVHVAAALTDDEIQSFGPMGSMDLTGRETARYVPVGDAYVGFSGADYLEVMRLAEAMQRTPNMRNKVSRGAVADAVIRWMVDPQARREEDLSTFVLAAMRPLVVRRAILVPVHYLSAESTFTVGHVEFRPVSKDDLDGWFRTIRGRFGEAADLRPTEDRWRHRMQGWVSAAVVVEAEQERADEIATYEADRSVSALRLFHPTMFHPALPCHTTLLGWETVRKTHRVYLGANDAFETSRDEMEIPPPYPWHLDNAELAHLRGIGLDSVSALLVLEPASDFDQKLIEALITYSRSALRPELSERLLYTVVALETLLLRDSSESIQQNIAERVAFIAANDAARRKQIVRDVKDAYGLRSAFVHHGATVEEMETVVRFARHVWDFFMRLIRNRERFSSKDDLFALVDALKYR